MWFLHSKNDEAMDQNLIRHLVAPDAKVRSSITQAGDLLICHLPQCSTSCTSYFLQNINTGMNRSGFRLSVYYDAMADAVRLCFETCLCYGVTKYDMCEPQDVATTCMT
jgi:hypothetical protein